MGQGLDHKNKKSGLGSDSGLDLVFLFINNKDPFGLEIYTRTKIVIL